MIVVVTGQPGVGKSTVSAALAGRRARGVHVKADGLQRMIVAGGEWPSAGTAEADRQLLLRTANAAVLARRFADAGFTTIVDEVIATAAQLAIVDELLGDARWVLLHADPAVVLRRDAERSKQTAAAYLPLGAAIAALVADRSLVVDTSELTADATVEHIERHLVEHPGKTARPTPLR